MKSGINNIESEIHIEQIWNKLKLLIKDVLVNEFRNMIKWEMDWVYILPIVSWKITCTKQNERSFLSGSLLLDLLWSAFDVMNFFQKGDKISGYNKHWD